MACEHSSWRRNPARASQPLANGWIPSGPRRSNLRSSPTIALTAASLIALAVVAAGQSLGDLDPTTYVSPSGEYALFVDPSERSGAGEGRYRFTQKGEELWSGSRPWTLREADVADDGLVAGYAYGAGPRGGKDDALTIVLLEATGKARLEERTTRKQSDGFHPISEPTVNGIFLDPANDRMVVRFRSELREVELEPDDWKLGESWVTYALSNGATGPRLRPKAALGADERIGPVAAARALPDTGLVLVHWTTFELEPGKFGSVFALLDEDGGLRWRLDWPAECSSTEANTPESKLWQKLRVRGAILSVEAGGRFTLCQAAKGERVRFEARRSTLEGERWEVREIEHAPYASEHAPGRATPMGERAAALPEFALTHRGSIVLGGQAAPPVLPMVSAFGVDDLGRVGVIRPREGRFEFVLLSADGVLQHTVGLPCTPTIRWSSFLTTWVGDERWLVTALCSEPQERAWFWLDPGAQAVSPIAGLESVPVQSIAGTGDGGFVTLGRSDGGRSEPRISAFDERAVQRWSLGGSTTLTDSSLFSAVSLTRTSAGEIAVLDNIRDLVQLFSKDGEFLRAVALKKSLGRDPGLTLSLRADVDGGWIVQESRGPALCLDLEGHVTASFQPRFADGRVFRVQDGVQGGPEGRLWASDGFALLALDRSGIVQRALLGTTPQADVLGKVTRLVIGPKNQAYAVDLRTGSVHVFDAGGRSLCVCRPDAQDFSDQVFWPSLMVSDEGEVFLAEREFADPTSTGFVRFAADGARRGTVPFTLDAPPERWYAQPGTHRRWVVGRDTLVLVAADGSRLRTLERAADGTWLRNLGLASVAADGSIAVEDRGRDDSVALHVFAATGEPLRSLVLPCAGLFAFDGTRVALGTYGTEAQAGAVVLLDASGAELGSFTPERTTHWAWRPFFSADGEELWLFDGKRGIERYGLN